MWLESKEKPAKDKQLRSINQKEIDATFIWYNIHRELNQLQTDRL
jgi:hypothetical protein